MTRRPLPETADAIQAEQALRRGDRLVRDSAGGWTLARTGQHVEAATVETLRADRRLALLPGNDQLPGFDDGLAQTFACGPGRKRRRASRAARQPGPSHEQGMPA